MTQSIPRTTSLSLDPSLAMHLAATQLSALAVTSMLLVAGLSVLIMDQVAALLMVRPEQGSHYGTVKEVCVNQSMKIFP